MPYDLTEDRREEYRATSIRAKERKIQLLSSGLATNRKLVEARLNPEALMPKVPSHGLSTLSLFAGGGGLDLGFDQAGFSHSASYELLDICGNTLRSNRPNWDVFSGPDGDVRNVDWAHYRGVDVVHGGPPCQPFSIAGKQAGSEDPRNMWPEFIRCIQAVRPQAFVAENVPGLLDEKFSGFVEKNILEPLSKHYHVTSFILRADEFGVPQSRKRVFFVGFRNQRNLSRFRIPSATHGTDAHQLSKNTARNSLGLPDIGFDTVVPTLRSGFTGPRNTTSVVNSKASMSVWEKLEIWPHGVQTTMERAAAYPPENGHYRLSGPECGLLQGFPKSWEFEGASYQILGQIGNSVCPPVAYAVAKNLAAALGRAQ